MCQTHKCFFQVSRCGMIYMEPSSLGWKPLLLSWLNNFPEFVAQKHKQLMIDLCDFFGPPLLSYVSINPTAVSVTLLFIYIVCSGIAV